jgi:Fic family protein
MGQPGWAFFPNLLPPTIQFDRDIAYASERAALALGNLNGSGRMLPNPTLLLQPFMNREALASSRIEGTRAEFDQLVLMEASEDGNVSDPDIQEVANYIRALNTGWHKPAERQFSPGFLMELHQQLLAGVRGSTKSPGALRSIQVIIGNRNDDLQRARFVPPPPEMVRGLLEDLCRYIEMETDIPALVRLAVIHYQFEAIHPFLDGNGRLGRLLMPLILGTWGALDIPLLYLSEYFEDHRDEYIDALYAVSQRGAWNEWILFTLRAIEQQASDAQIQCKKLLGLQEELRLRYQAGRSDSVMQIIDSLFARPALNIKQAATHAQITPAAAGRIIDTLVRDGILEEVTGQKRNRLFLARGIMDVMRQRRPPDEINV